MLSTAGVGVGSPSGQGSQRVLRLDQTIVSSLASHRNIQSTEQNLSFLSTKKLFLFILDIFIHQYMTLYA